MMRDPGFGQSYSNLDFEQATLIPVPGGYACQVQIDPALPEWTGFLVLAFGLRFLVAGRTKELRPFGWL